MTKKEVLKWRLKEQPTAESLRDLVNSGILSKEEAREMLVSKESEEDRDKKSLESEIKFLRELVDKLATGNKSRIVETIKYVEKPYYRWDWYQPYVTWYTTSTADNVTLCSTATTGTSQMLNLSTSAQDFTSIKTF